MRLRSWLSNTGEKEFNSCSVTANYNGGTKSTKRSGEKGERRVTPRPCGAQASPSVGTEAAGRAGTPRAGGERVAQAVSGPGRTDRSGHRRPGGHTAGTRHSTPSLRRLRPLIKPCRT